MRAVAGTDVGMECQVFSFFSNWDGAPPPPTPGVGALHKLRTLFIGSGGTDFFCP